MERCSEPGAVRKGVWGERNEKAIILFSNLYLNKLSQWEALQDAVGITTWGLGGRVLLPNISLPY